MDQQRKAGYNIRWLLCIVIGVLFVTSLGATWAQATRSFNNPNGLPYLPNEVIVTMKPGTTVTDVSNLCKSIGALGYKPLLLERTYRISLKDIAGKIPVNEKFSLIKANPKVAIVEKNAIYRPLDVPNDTLYASTPNPFDPFAVSGQWALQQGLSGGVLRDHIFAPEAWDIEKGQKDVVVAVIDTGTRTSLSVDDEGRIRRYPHPDLGPYKRIMDPTTGRIVYQIDLDVLGQVNNRLLSGVGFTSEFDDRSDDAPSDFPEDSGWASHGTHVAGIIAAKTNNSAGVASLCWNNVWILPLRVFPDKVGLASSDMIVNAIMYASIYKNTNAVSGKTLKVNVINMSLGSQSPSPAIESAIKQAVKMGIVVVASAGNDWDYGPYPPGYPGAFEDVICVSATNPNDKIAEFSQRGHSVDIAAPGTDILSTVFSGGSVNEKAIDDYWEPPEEDPTDPGTPAASPASNINAVEPEIAYDGTDIWGNGYAEMSGTSMAAPMVSAAAALVMSRNVKGEDVREILTSTATPIGLGRPNDSYGWGLLNVYEALKKASIDVEINTPANGGTAFTTKPKFRIDFRNANPSTIKVWINPVDTDGDGTPDNTPVITGTDSNFSDMYSVSDEESGEGTLIFTREMANGTYQVGAMAESKLQFDIPPLAPPADYDEVSFTVKPQTLSAGWHLFSIPLSLEDTVVPGDLFNTSGVMARWNYATSRTARYAMYSFDGSRNDPEAGFNPPSVNIINNEGQEVAIVRPVNGLSATPPAGLGYWVYLTETVPLPELAGTSLDSGPYEIGLYRGWNMVGNPFPFGVDWSTVLVEYAGNRVSIGEAVTKGWISSYAYRYDTLNRRYKSEKITTAMMPAWEAEWVSVRVTGINGWPEPDIKLIVPPNPYTGVIR